MKRFFLVNLIVGLLPTLAYAAELIKSRPLTEVQATQYYQYNVQVDMPIYSKVELSLLQGPKGMRLSQAQQLLWQTDYDDAGQYAIVLQAQDGEDTQLQEFTLTVNKKNRPPVIRSQAKNRIAEGETFYYRIDAVDPDGDPLSIRFDKIPKGASHDSDSITWETDYESAGEHAIQITVSDAESSVEQRFLLTVEDVNRAPVFIEPDALDLQLVENQAWQFTPKVSDPDGDEIALRLGGAPEGMMLENGILTWQPSFTQAGEYRVDVIANDGKDDTILTLYLQVENVNRLPEITSEPVVSVNEGDEYRYNVRAYDPDETPLTYRLIRGPEGMEMQGRHLHWKPDYGMAGEYSILIAVSDGEAEVDQEFVLEVIHTNREPIILSKPETHIKEAEKFVYLFEVEDPDGDELLIEYDIPEQVSREDNKIFWQTDFKSAGLYPFRIRVSDKETTVEQRFVLVVENVNHLPVFTSEPITNANEAIYYEYQLMAEDIDDEELTFALEKSPRGMHIKEGLLMWIPNFDQAGQHEVIVSVTDGIDVVKQSFVINVADTNREPTIEEVPDQLLQIGGRLRYPLQIDDLDGDKVTVRLVHAPNNMSINRRKELIWKAGAQDLGTHDVVIEASDGDLAVRTRFQMEVVEEIE